ncbi:hypothetical protein [Micromonospora inositola]|nr:hypothetical protein [Micromonospora inositola]
MVERRLRQLAVRARLAGDRAAAAERTATTARRRMARLRTPLR